VCAAQSDVVPVEALYHSWLLLAAFFRDRGSFRNSGRGRAFSSRFRFFIHMGVIGQLYVLLIRTCLWLGLFAILDGFFNLALGFFEALHNFFVIQLATNVISTELPLQLAAGFTQAAFESADPQAYGTNSLRQALRSDNQGGHHAADEPFKKTHIKPPSTSPP